MTGCPDIGRVRRAYGRLAASYDRSSARWDRFLALDAGRRWVCERTHGAVLEVGIGTGLSLPHYPPAVQLTGIDATPEMLDVARRRASQLGMHADLRIGDAEALDWDDESFDAVVFANSLCSIPRPAAAVREAHRVLRAGGALLLTEHVRSPHVLVRMVQHVLDPLFVWLEADHLLREPVHDVHAIGFIVETVERSSFGVMERVHAAKPPAREASAPQ